MTEVAAGREWVTALLEAVSRWPAVDECVDGQDYHYIVGGEALDLLQIAERLLSAAGELVPEEEKLDFLFRSHHVVKLAPEQLRELMGEERFGQYLNFFYGVTAEEALLQAVEEEVRKEEQGLNFHSEAWIVDEAFQRVYDATQRTLLQRFRREHGLKSGVRLTLGQLKEFTYWRFKYRLRHNEKARAASDTRKALDWIRKRAPEQTVAWR